MEICVANDSVDRKLEGKWMANLRLCTLNDAFLFMMRFVVISEEKSLTSNDKC